MAAAAGTAVDRETEGRVTALIESHGASLMRTARKVSLCSDDAHDAYQRALEIYMRRVATLDPATEAAWMRVVIRNEALAVRRGRAQVAGEDLDFDRQLADNQRPLEERMESAERVSRSAEALRHLKRDEAHALMLKAEGLSYDEIGARLGWTYTKVNRCITEGRARFREVYGGIESGEQCERFAPLLAQLSAGAADAADLVLLKPHLRNCGRCRADVRRMRGGRFGRALALLPFPGLLDRLRPASVKAELYGLMSRLGTSDAATPVLAGGGGRSAGATALIGVCLAGAGAGGYCAVGGPLPDMRTEREPKTQRAEPRQRPVALIRERADGVLAGHSAVATAIPGKPARPASESSGTTRERARRSTPQEPVTRDAVPAPAPAASREFDFETAEPEPGPAPAPAAAPTAGPARSVAPPSGGESEFGFEE